MNKKYFLSFILVFCVCFLFAGCSNVSVVSTIYTDGSRSYNYQIVVDQVACANYSIDANAVMTKIDTLAQDYEAKLLAYALSNHRSMEGVKFTYKASSNNPFVYNISLTFASLRAYRNFYGITDEDIANQELETEPSLFTTRVILENSQIGTQQDFLHSIYAHLDWQDLKQSFADDFFGGDATKCDEFLSKIAFNVVRCYPASYKLHSNANEVTMATQHAGLNSKDYATYTAFLWKCTLAEPTPNVYLYYNVLTAENRAVWYLTALILTAIFGLVLWLVVRKHENKKQEVIAKVEEHFKNNPLLLKPRQQDLDAILKEIDESLIDENLPNTEDSTKENAKEQISIEIPPKTKENNDKTNEKDQQQDKKDTDK